MPWTGTGPRGPGSVAVDAAVLVAVEDQLGAVLGDHAAERLEVEQAVARLGDAGQHRVVDQDHARQALRASARQHGAEAGQLLVADAPTATSGSEGIAVETPISATSPWRWTNG
jgi:hypothetical protein